jgi:hypothetical protein
MAHLDAAPERPASSGSCGPASQVRPAGGDVTALIGDHGSAKPTPLVRLLAVFACAAVLAAGAYYRFHLITKEGMSEGDTIGYYNIAKKWAKGDRTEFWQDQFYRPVIYELNARSLTWFGDNDYSIKAVNGAFDVASLLLMVLIARHLTGRMLPGIAAALVYALLPYEIQSCRSGMPHALSSFFVLLAVYLFRPRLQPQSASAVRMLSDAGAGLSLGIAANTHADLAFLGLGFVACQCVQTLSPGIHRRTVVRLFLRAAALTLAFAVPYALGFALFGFDKVVHVFSREVGLVSFTPSYVTPAPLYRVPLDILTVSSQEAFGARGWIPLLWLIPPVAWCLRRVIYREWKLPAAYTPWFLIVSYMLAFPLTIGAFDRTHARIFIPLIPLILIGATCAIIHVAGTRTSGRATLLLTLSTLLLLYFAPNAAGRDGYFNNDQRYSQTIFRGTYDAVGRRVDSDHRLLIVPSSAYYNHGFQLDFYFGKNAEFLADQLRSEPYTPEFLDRIMTKGKFSYILFDEEIDLRFTDPKWPSTVREQPWFKGFMHQPYDFSEEAKLLNKFFAQYRAHPISRIAKGTIYSLRKRPLFTNSAFDRGALDSWRATGYAPIFALTPNDERQGLGRFHIDTRMKAKYPTAADPSVVTAGALESEIFRIEEDVIGFSIAGASDPGNIHVALLVTGVEMRSAPGGFELQSGQWDVSAYRGRNAQIVIRDLDPDQAKGIAVTGFYYVF